MATPDHDDLAAGEALLRALVAGSSAGEQEEALDGVWDCYERLRDGNRYEDALALLDELLGWQLRDESEGDPDAAEELAHTMLGRAAMLREVDRYAEAVAQCDELLMRYEKDFEDAPSELRGCIANALFFKGNNLLSLERWLEALAAMDTLVARESVVPEDARRWVRFAREGRAEALAGLGDSAGALEAYSDGIASLAEEEDPEVVLSVEGMMLAQARLLAGLERTDEAITTFDSLIARSQAPRRVALTFVAKMGTLADRLAQAKHPESGDLEAMVATADQALHRFGSSDDVDIRWCAAYCVNAKITALNGLGRKDAAAFAAEQLVENFGADLDPRIEAIVSPHAHRIRRGRSRLGFRSFG